MLCGCRREWRCVACSSLSGVRFGKDRRSVFLSAHSNLTCRRAKPFIEVGVVIEHQILEPHEDGGLHHIIIPCEYM